MHTATIQEAPQGAPQLWVGRALHLLDLENLAGGPGDSYCEVTSAYRRLLGPGPRDLVVLGVDASGAFRAHDAWPNTGLVVGRGPDGADRALVSRGFSNLGTGRFDTLIVASGDHAFAPLVEAASSSGMYTVVVSRSSALSRELQRLAHRSVRFNEPLVPGRAPMAAEQ